MKTDHIKEYAVEAFRFYKAAGGVEGYKTKSPLDGAELADLEAVERTLYIAGRSIEGRAIIQAVETVYFTDAEKALKRGDIKLRVHKASELTVYRLLTKAR